MNSGACHLSVTFLSRVCHVLVTCLSIREALKAAWYDLQSARDTYRFAVGEEGMNRQVLLRYMEVR